MEAGPNRHVEDRLLSWRVQDAFRSGPAKAANAREEIEQRDLIGGHRPDRREHAIGRGGDDRGMVFAEMKHRRELVDAVAFSRGGRRWRDHGEANGDGDASHEHHQRAEPALSIQPSKRPDQAHDAGQRDECAPYTPPSTRASRSSSA